jgi:hypothetical protein
MHPSDLALEDLLRDVFDRGGRSIGGSSRKLIRDVNQLSVFVSDGNGRGSAPDVDPYKISHVLAPSNFEEERVQITSRFLKPPLLLSLLPPPRLLLKPPPKPPPNGHRRYAGAR